MQNEDFCLLLQNMERDKVSNPKCFFEIEKSVARIGTTGVCAKGITEEGKIIPGYLNTALRNQICKLYCPVDEDGRL